MRHKTVLESIAASEEWGAELETLRALVLASRLEGTVEWRAPCFTRAGRNVVGLASFKAYFGLWLHDGFKLADPRGVLIIAQEGKTKCLRQWRLQSAKEIAEGDVKAYCREARAVAEGWRQSPHRKRLRSRRAPRCGFPRSCRRRSQPTSRPRQASRG